MCFNKNHSGFFGGHDKMQIEVPFGRERTEQSFWQPLLDQHLWALANQPGKQNHCNKKTQNWGGGEETCKLCNLAWRKMVVRTSVSD